MIRILKSFPVHVFLIPAFFMLHVLNSYYGLIPGKAYATLGSYYFLLSVLLLITGKLILGSFSKAGVWTAMMLVVFYFFGSFHDFITGLSVPRLLSSYTVLLTILFMAGIAFTLYLKRHTGYFLRTHQYLNLLFAVLVSIEIGIVAYNMATGKQEENNYAHAQAPVLKSLPPQNSPAPDIFFIVFDEYASSLALKKYYNYDNTAADSLLRANRFYIATKSQSNYNSTPLSIGSCFNMQYFNQVPDGDKVTTKKILQALYSLKKSELPKLLAAKGYDIYNFGLCDLDHYPVHTSRAFAEYEILPLYQETLWGRIERDIWWNAYKFNIPVLHTLRRKQFAKEAQRSVARNFQNFSSTLAALKQQSSRPKFIFTHIMMPHAPFFLDEKGHYNDLTLASDMYSQSLYLKQLAYCNKWIDSLAKAANRPFSRPRVVIIEGDHGFRDRRPGVREKQFMNLNAYYFSDNEYSMLYDSISPINTFRVISNKYFHTTLQPMKDSTILLK